MYYIPGIAQKTEQVLLTYCSSSLYNSGLIDPAVNFYTGINNQDKGGPACIVTCNSFQEAAPYTNLWKVNADISCRETAYDNVAGDNTNTSSMISFTGNIHSLFKDRHVRNGINTMISGSTQDAYVHQVLVRDGQMQIEDDAWHSNLNLDVIIRLCTSSNYQI